MRSISIETCYSLSGGERFIQAEKNTAEFIAAILKRKGWGMDRVKKHQKKLTEQKTLELYYITPDGYRYKKALYRVSDMKHEIFYPVQHDDEVDAGQDGYAGVKCVAVDKFQAWVE